MTYTLNFSLMSCSIALFFFVSQAPLGAKSNLIYISHFSVFPLIEILGNSNNSK